MFFSFRRLVSRVSIREVTVDQQVSGVSSQLPLPVSFTTGAGELGTRCAVGWEHAGCHHHAATLQDDKHIPWVHETSGVKLLGMGRHGRVGDGWGGGRGGRSCGPGGLEGILVEKSYHSNH